MPKIQYFSNANSRVAYMQATKNRKTGQLQSDYVTSQQTLR